jgi:hypothetical protein
MSDHIKDLVLSKETAAKILGMATRTLENMVSKAKQEKREYPWVKRTNGKSWIIIAPFFEEWLLEGNKPVQKRGSKAKYF